MVTSSLASGVLEDDVGIGIALAAADLLLGDVVRKKVEMLVKKSLEIASRLKFCGGESKVKEMSGG
jgi:hypothetical protein